MNRKKGLFSFYRASFSIPVMWLILLTGCGSDSTTATNEAGESEKDKAAAESCIFSHAGFVVNDIDRAMDTYRTMGFSQIAPPVERVWDNESYEVDGTSLASDSAVRFKEGYLR